MTDYWTAIINMDEEGYVNTLSTDKNDAQIFSVYDSLDSLGTAEIDYKEFETILDSNRDELSQRLAEFYLEEEFKEVVSSRPISVEPYLPESSTETIDNYVNSVGKAPPPNADSFEQYFEEMGNRVVEEIDQNYDSFIEAVDYEEFKNDLKVVWTDDMDVIRQNIARAVVRSSPDSYRFIQDISDFKNFQN